MSKRWASIPQTSTAFESSGESKAGQLFNCETGRRIAAVVPVHVFGHPVEMDELVEVADDLASPIEDAAEALGKQYKGRQCAQPWVCWVP